MKSKSYGRCTCGTRIEMDPAYGDGYCGTFRDACEPCANRAEEQAYRDQWMDFAYGPGPAVFDGDF